MENGSRALIMAGGILIAILIISALVLMFVQLGDYQEEQRRLEAAEQHADHNNQFLPYDQNDLTIMELKSLFNMIESNNNKNEDKQIILTIEDRKDPIEEIKNYMDQIGDEYIEPLRYIQPDYPAMDIPEEIKLNAIFECVEIKYSEQGYVEEMVFEDQTEKMIDNASGYTP